MLFIVRDTEKYRAQAEAGHHVVAQVHQHRTSNRLVMDGEGKSYKDLYGTASGDCLVLGMGPSRHGLPADIRIPVFGINQAAVDHTVDWWLAHDWVSLQHEKDVPKGLPLITFANNWLKPSWADVKSGGRTVYFYDIFPDPTAHLKRPLYWNAATLGLGCDLLFRMGFSRIFTLGCDLGESPGYKSKFLSDEDLAAGQRQLYYKICFMFTKEELPKWNPDGKPVIDLSGGRMPCEKWDLEKALPFLRGGK